MTLIILNGHLAICERMCSTVFQKSKLPFPALIWLTLWESFNYFSFLRKSKIDFYSVMTWPIKGKVINPSQGDSFDGLPKFLVPLRWLSDSSIPILHYFLAYQRRKPELPDCWRSQFSSFMLWNDGIFFPIDGALTWYSIVYQYFDMLWKDEYMKYLILYLVPI